MSSGIEKSLTNFSTNTRKFYGIVGSQNRIEPSRRTVPQLLDRRIVGVEREPVHVLAHLEAVAFFEWHVSLQRLSVNCRPNGNRKYADLRLGFERARLDFCLVLSVRLGDRNLNRFRVWMLQNDVAVPVRPNCGGARDSKHLIGFA